MTASSTAVRTVPHGSRGAVVAVGAVFAINGLAIGGWAGVLPALRSRLGIDAGTLAVLLLVVGVAAVVSMQVGGRMADRVGGRRVTRTGRRGHGRTERHEAVVDLVLDQVGEHGAEGGDADRTAQGAGAADGRRRSPSAAAPATRRWT